MVFFGVLERVLKHIGVSYKDGSASLKDAQAQLGHSKMSTTVEIYTFPVRDHQRTAVESLAQMVTSRTNAWKDCRQQHSKFNRLDGRPEWIRTIDLFRVKEALWTN